MKFIAERSAILGAVSFVAAYTETCSPIQILETVKIEASGGRVSVTATDLRRAAADSFPAHIDRDGVACISGSLIAKAIKGTDATEVMIDCGEREAIVQIGGRVKLRVPILPSDTFPDMAMLTAEAACSFDVDASFLSRREKEVAFAEGSAGEAWNEGTLWEVVGQSLRICAMDRVVLSRISIKTPTLDMPRVTVPTMKLPPWEGVVRIAVTEGFMRFSCDGQTVATKLVDAPFPEYDRIIPTAGAELRFDRAELLASVNRMALLSQKGGTPVMIVGRDGWATVSTTFDGREIEDRVGYEGDDFQISIQQRSLSNVLSSISSEIVLVRFTNHLTNITIHDPRDDSRVTLIAPYRDVRLSRYLPEEQIAA